MSVLSLELCNYYMRRALVKDARSSGNYSKSEITGCTENKKRYMDVCSTLPFFPFQQNHLLHLFEEMYHRLVKPIYLQYYNVDSLLNGIF